MMKYISKFTIDILPSIIATIVGAYIVTHYINPKNDADKPAASVASTPDAAIDSKAAVASPAEKSADIVGAPAVPAGKPRVEKASIDKSEKDSASAPNPGRHQPVIRDKPVAKATPAVVTPPVATVSIAPAASPTPEERRDANELARAAIERLRTTREAQPVVQEAAKPTEPSHVQEAARSVPAPQTLQQLPPPINVSTPPIESYGSTPSRPPYAADRNADSRGPVPPGDIPSPPPLDLQADSARSNRGERTNVAEDVLSAAKSVFHSVIPKQFDR
ncbi:hypothetical protein FNL55_23195 [Tardiphaga sp. vice352]|nr:hypothetical protein [Tardiphaga sp.]QDM19635.1 hypothetical protein FNL53_23720 [Tardiphaga sp. vice278]QDM24633.1 hypothetical protein FIU28_22505 [Tardiphaga sp. vice154]QDM29824.1 hypothetical protein FNL56_23945 [Tardiphaga sp. vice304]QDM34916.1 hypothetical protein FNL55_23195 [Tardiphaga sp. vice352]